jgi:hypothetical protein
MVDFPFNIKDLFTYYQDTSCYYSNTDLHVCYKFRCPRNARFRGAMSSQQHTVGVLLVS